VFATLLADTPVSQLGMISLKKALEEAECRELFRASLEAYLDALAAIVQYSPSLPEAEQESNPALAELHRRLSVRPTPEQLKEAREIVEGHLRRHKERLEAAFEKQSRDVQEILAALAEATQLLERRHLVHTGNLTEFTRQLELLARVDNLAEIRRRITTQVSQMKSALQQANREQQETLNQLRRELEIFRTRLQHAEHLAATDPLTGLANRRECDRRLAELSRSGTRFSIMLLDLDRFKRFNDHYGHQVGDQVLVLFSQRLREQFRATDLVGRWGGDEFMVIMPCSLEVAQLKAREVSEHVNGWYTVNAGGGPLRVLVRASVGVAECAPGESLPQVFSRADEALYADKEARTAC